MNKIEIKYREVADLVGYANNSKIYPQWQIDQIKASIKEFGMVNPIGLHDGTIVFGHGRWEALKQLGEKEVPTVDLSHLSKAQMKALVIADNRIAEGAEWDNEVLSIELEELAEMEFDFSDLGFEFEDLDFSGIGDEVEEGLYSDGEKGSMDKNFGVSPFSVFDAKSGNWQNRKRYWTGKGIKSSDGRDIENTNASESINRGDDQGGSIFDPVLCEIGYQWFCKPNGMVLDPFAGGSVRGLMASFLDKKYFGVDLREEQIEANKQQLNLVSGIAPNWVCGDSLNIKELAGDGFKADLLFSCPPYADLEVYSDNDADISNMPYEKFMDIYSQIIKNCYDLLEDDSFAFWVIGEVRDKAGNYRNFLGDTISAFKGAGFNYYNEFVYLTPIGSLPLRAGRTIKASRKVGKAHQNVLVFVKGDGKKASERCGDIDILSIDEELE